GVPRVAQDAEDGGRVPTAVLRYRLELLSRLLPALIALDRERPRVLGQMRQRGRHLGTGDARQAPCDRSNGRAVFDGEEPEDLVDGGGLVLDDVAVGRVTKRPHTFGSAPLLGTLDVGA